MSDVSEVGDWGCGAETLGGLFSMTLGLGRLRVVGGLARVAVEDASGFATTRAELAERVAGVGVTAARPISSSAGVGVGVELGGAIDVAPAARAGDSFALECETPEGSVAVVGERSATGMGTGTIVGCDTACVPDGTSSAGFCKTTARSDFA